MCAQSAQNKSPPPTREPPKASPVRVSVCLCVRLSRSCIVTKRVIIFSNFSHHSSFTLRNVMAIFGRGPPPKGGAECRWGMKKSRFTTNVSLYLGSDTISGHMLWNINSNLYDIYRMVL